MCRSIRQLRSEELVTTEDIRAAALQYVRKISGYRRPSRANRELFERTVREIAESSRRLLEGLVIGRAGTPSDESP